MSKTVVHGEHQKEFIRIFDRVCNWNSRGERWGDMVMLFAIEISNVVDKGNLAERTEIYKAIAGRYKPEEYGVFAELLTELVEALEENPFQDFLGDMYMELCMGNDHTGQFFTPYHLCRLMAEIAMEKDLKEIEDYVTVNEPACGAGANLIAIAEAMHKRGINYQRKALFVAQDLDQTVALMCYIQLSLIGCAGYVHVGDTLCSPDTADPLFGDGTSKTWMTPMFFSDEWNIRRFRHFNRFIHGQNDAIKTANDEIDGKEKADNAGGVQTSFLRR